MNNNDIAKQILAEGQLEEDARQAQKFIIEYQNLMNRMAEFSKRVGNPNNPIATCHGILSAYAMKHLESKIITPND